MKKQLLVLASLVGLLLLSGQLAQATTYSFNGAAYTIFTNFTPPCPAGQPCANYPAGSKLTGQFTTAAPLASNLHGVNIFPQVTSFSFNDGLNTYSSADPNVRVIRFQVSTDASGNIALTLTDNIQIDLWQTGSSPHNGARFAEFLFQSLSSFGYAAFNNVLCLVVGPSPAGVPDSCGTPVFLVGSSDSEAQAPSGTWSSGISIVPPTIAKSFGAGSITLNGSTSLGFTIHNPNASTLTGVGFTDTLPAGLVVSTPNGLTGSCGGGTITATAGSSSVSLTGASLASSASCSFSVNVTGTILGTVTNTTSTVSSVEGGAGATASASVTVTAVPPPPITLTQIPTLQEWMLWVLGLILLAAGGVALRSRRNGP